MISVCKYIYLNIIILFSYWTQKNLEGKTVFCSEGATNQSSHSRNNQYVEPTCQCTNLKTYGWLVSCEAHKDHIHVQ